jgi:short-subunit dehydrogenase
VDHLVNNAGIGSSFMFEEVSDATPLKRVMVRSINREE